MGANIASNVAAGEFTETTLALPDSISANETFGNGCQVIDTCRKIFNTSTFDVGISNDVPTAGRILQENTNIDFKSCFCYVYVVKSIFLFQFSCLLYENNLELCGGLKNIVALGAGFCDGRDLGIEIKAYIFTFRKFKFLFSFSSCFVFHNYFVLQSGHEDGVMRDGKIYKTLFSEGYARLFIRILRIWRLDHNMYLSTK